MTYYTGLSKKKILTPSQNNLRNEKRREKGNQKLEIAGRNPHEKWEISYAHTCGSDSSLELDNTNHQGILKHFGQNLFNYV